MSVAASASADDRNAHAGLCPCDDEEEHPHPARLGKVLGHDREVDGGRTTDNAASSGAATRARGRIVRRGGAPPGPERREHHRRHHDLPTSDLAKRYATGGAVRRRCARSARLSSERAGAARSEAEAGDEDLVGVGEDRPRVGLTDGPKVRLHREARLRHPGDRVEVVLVDVAVPEPSRQTEPFDQPRDRAGRIVRDRRAPRRSAASRRERRRR